MLVGEILHNSATRAPDRIALIGRGKRLSYAEFEQSANRLANALIDLKLDKGAKVAILSTNRPAYAIAYFAIAKTPYISAHCSTRSIASELADVLNRTAAEVLILEAQFATVIKAALPELDRPPKLILLDPSAELDGATHIDDFVSGKSAEVPDITPDESDGLAITLTGGTTGFPKAVLVSHRARCASAIAAAEDLGLDEDDIAIASTPLFHTAGLFVWFGTAVLQGATVVLPDAWEPVKFMQIVEKEKVTAAFMVPSQLNDLIMHAEFSAERLNTLRNIGYAGAPMSRALFDRVRSVLPKVSFTENYGQSEACPITIRCDRHGDEKLGTVGKVAINAELGIVDQEGSQIRLRIEEWKATRIIDMVSEEILDAAPRSLLGYSIGRLDDGVLIIESSKVDFPLLDDDGTPMSEQATLVERFTVSEDGKRLDYEVSVTDPENLVGAATWDAAWKWIPGTKIMPFERELD